MAMVAGPCWRANCIIGVKNNGGQGKGYPNLDQTFQADFNELLFTSTASKLIKTQLNSHNAETDSPEFALTIIRKIQMKQDFAMSPARNSLKNSVSPETIFSLRENWACAPIGRQSGDRGTVRLPKIRPFTKETRQSAATNQ